MAAAERFSTSFWTWKNIAGHGARHVRTELHRVHRTADKTLRRDTDVCIGGRSYCRAGRIDFDKRNGCARQFGGLSWHCNLCIFASKCGHKGGPLYKWRRTGNSPPSRPHGTELWSHARTPGHFVRLGYRSGPSRGPVPRNIPSVLARGHTKGQYWRLWRDTFVRILSHMAVDMNDHSQLWVFGRVRGRWRHYAEAPSGICWCRNARRKAVNCTSYCSLPRARVGRSYQGWTL